MMTPHLSYSLSLDHLSLWMLEALGVQGVLVEAVEQLQGVDDPLVGVVLIQRLLPLIDLTHVLNTDARTGNERAQVPPASSFNLLYLILLLF